MEEKRIVKPWQAGLMLLVGTWMASGTVPVMIYYGMKVLTPGLFLPVVCILCTLMSTMAGTSWGTLATVGVACMGAAQGLGVPLPAAAGAVCTGAFFGDKVSPLSDSPVITATVCEVPLMDGIRHALISTGPAYLISLVFYFVYGLRYSGGSVGGEVYEDILSTVSAEFWLSPVLLLPVLVVVVLILMKKPTIPTFIAGIAAGAVMAMLCQGVSLHDILTVMYSGFSADTGSDVVNSMLNRGGFTSMLSTIGLLIAAGLSKGTYQLVAEDVIHAGYAIMGECRYDNVAVGFRGRYSFEVTVHGQTRMPATIPRSVKTLSSPADAWPRPSRRCRRSSTRTSSTARGACAIWRAAIPARSLCRRSAASSLTATSFRARRTRSALRRSWRRRSSSAFPARSTCASSRENRPTCSRSRWRRIIRSSKFCRRSSTPSRARTFRAHTMPRSAIRIF